MISAPTWRLTAGNHTSGQFDFKITVSNATHSETFGLAKGASHLWISEQTATRSAS